MSLRKERATKGLCPYCGKDAAPYYRCQDCHQLEQVRKAIRNGLRAGAFRQERCSKDRRQKKVWLVPGADRSWTERDRSLSFGERDRPRLKGVPVDVERELYGILERAGRGLTEQDLIEAWAKLRPRPNRQSIAGDLAKIIVAGDKRARKAAVIASRLPHPMTDATDRRER